MTIKEWQNLKRGDLLISNGYPGLEKGVIVKVLESLPATGSQSIRIEVIFSPIPNYVVGDTFNITRYEYYSKITERTCKHRSHLLEV